MQFLSMKLATVNPRLDFNIEELLTKEVSKPQKSNATWNNLCASFFPSHNHSFHISAQIIQSKAGPSLFGFPPDLPMPYLPQHPSHHGLIPPCLPNMGSSPDLLRRTINSQLTSLVSGFKEPVQVFFKHPELNYLACTAITLDPAIMSDYFSSCIFGHLFSLMYNNSHRLGIISLKNVCAQHILSWFWVKHDVFMCLIQIGLHIVVELKEIDVDMKTRW